MRARRVDIVSLTSKGFTVTDTGTWVETLGSSRELSYYLVVIADKTGEVELLIPARVRVQEQDRSGDGPQYID